MVYSTFVRQLQGAFNYSVILSQSRKGIRESNSMFPGQVYTDVVYPENSFIMFGKESRGLPEELLFAHPGQCVRIPMRDSLRSLNLSNSVAIAVYEILRQDQFEGLQVDGKLMRFDWSDAN